MYLLTAVADFTVTKARGEVVTFAYPLGQTYYSLYIQNPSGTFNYRAFFEPMNNRCWFCIGLFCMLTPFILYLSTWYVYIVLCIVSHLSVVVHSRIVLIF